MADRRAFIVAVEKFLDPDFGTVPYAEAGAKALSEALAAAGYLKANQFVLLGPHATKAAVESRLRKLRKVVRKGDEVVVYLAGRGYMVGGASYLACWDTLQDDMSGTGLYFPDLLAEFDKSKADQVAVLMSVGTGPTPHPYMPYLEEEEIIGAFLESAKMVGLSACLPSESVHATAGAQPGDLWTQLVVEAVSGRARTAVDANGRLTALGLHRFIQDEFPRRLRKHVEAGLTQTPTLYGNNTDAVIVTFDPNTADAVLDPARLRRVVFRSDSTGRVKDLSGFRKTFTVPENAGSSNRKFVARIAAADVKADVDAVFDAAREHLGYKRKDVEVSADSDGFGFVRGPDFEYTVTAALDTDDPSQVTWRREIGQFADPGFVRSAGFDAVFGKLFDQLVFEFATPVDVAALVDRLEDAPLKGVRVSVGSDGKECEVTLAGYAGRVTVGRSALTVRGRAGDSAGLLDQFLRFLRTIGPVGEPLALQ